MKGNFINFSNHPSSKWGKEQLIAAQIYGDITDIPFPSVDPMAETSDIINLADEILLKIRLFENPTVLVQGEFTLAFAVVKKLQSAGIKAVAACSVRVVTELPNEKGALVKKTYFRFMKFREYA